MLIGSVVKVINPTSYMCGQQGIVGAKRKGILKYHVEIKGRFYWFAESDIAEVTSTFDDLKRAKVLGTLGELTQKY
jgi:hypothetical protein